MYQHSLSLLLLVLYLIFCFLREDLFLIYVWSSATFHRAPQNSKPCRNHHRIFGIFVDSSKKCIAFSTRARITFIRMAGDFHTLLCEKKIVCPKRDSLQWPMNRTVPERYKNGIPGHPQGPICSYASNNCTELQHNRMHLKCIHVRRQTERQTDE